MLESYSSKTVQHLNSLYSWYMVVVVMEKRRDFIDINSITRYITEKQYEQHFEEDFYIGIGNQELYLINTQNQLASEQWLTETLAVWNP